MIPEGVYRLTESEAPLCYLLSDKVCYFIVDKNGYITKGALNSQKYVVAADGATKEKKVSETFVNDYNRFQITKIDEENRTTRLTGAQFKFEAEHTDGVPYNTSDVIGYIVSGTNMTANINTTYGIAVHTGDVIQVASDGTIKLRMLSDGSWTYSEVVAPAGYNLPEDADGNPVTQYFTVANGLLSNAGNENVNEIDIDYTNTNLSLYMNIRVEKVDVDDTSILLDGAVFDVYEWNDKLQA